MTKYAIYTKWFWPDGLPSVEAMQENQQNFKPKTKALDVIWWRINGNTHQSVIIFASEQNAKDEAALRNEHCKKTAEALGYKMEDGTMGSIISIMSGLLPAIQNLASKLIRSRAFIPSVHWTDSRGKFSNRKQR